MLHRQFQDELAQRRRGPIRKRLETDWHAAGMNLLESVNRLADLLDDAEQRLNQSGRSELQDYTEASIRRLERLRYRLHYRND